MIGSRHKGELICSASEQARLINDVKRVPWMQTLFRRWRERVDRFQQAPRIYIEKGLAFFDSCPRCQAQLTFDPFAPREHRCSRCGFDAQGPEYDGAWHRQYHEWVAETAVLAGILYRLEGRQADADLVRHVLMQYADNYERFPLFDNELGPTRIFQSTYLEALWLANLIAALDLVHSSGVITPRDEGCLREQLFYPSTAIIRSFNEGISNRQAFNNVGLGAVALYFGDEALLHDVLEGPGGFAFHMRESVLEDGLWYEGETYHFATLFHLLTLAEMCRRAGIDLYGDGPYGSLRPLFDAPLRLMYPDLTFPSRKDSWFGRGIGYHKEIYEIGYSRYGDARYGALLADAYRRGARRDALGWRSFLYAQPDLPSADAVSVSPHRSVLSAGTGLAVLRNADGRRYLSMEYGHYGGGHGHPDRLHINFYADERLWLGDPGTGWYHVPELAWYRSTLAHNTVSVDASSQRPHTEGDVLAFIDLPHLQAVQAETATAYDGVVMRRTVCLIDDYYLDLFDLTAETERLYDWVYQSPVDLKVDVPMTSSSLSDHGDGYAFLEEVRGGRTDDDITAAFVRGDAKFLVRIAGQAGTEVYTARAPGIPLRTEDAMRVLLLRRRAARTRFEVLAGAQAAGAENVTWRREAGGWLKVTGADGEDVVYVGDGPGHIACLRFFYSDGSNANTWIAWNELSEVTYDQTAWVRTDFPLKAAWARVVGDEVHLQLPPRFGRVTVHAPRAERVRLNGDLVAFDRDGQRVVVTQPEPVAIVPAWPRGHAVFSGLSNVCPVDVYHYGDRSGENGGNREGSRATTAGGDGEPRANGKGSENGAARWRLRASDAGGSAVSVEKASSVEKNVSRYMLRIRPRSTSVGDHVRLRLEAGDVGRSERLSVAAPVQASIKLESGSGGPFVVCNAVNKTGATLDVGLQLELPSGFSPRGPVRWTGPIPAASSHQFAVPIAFQHAGDRYVVDVALTGCGYATGVQREFVVGRARRLGDRHSLGHSLDRSTFEEVAEEVAAWQRASGSPLRLHRDDQASITERPWGGPEDLSATAYVGWDDNGIWLTCRVWDDHVVFNPALQYAFHNDGLQVYFDFRPASRRGGSHYTPGLAAYLVTALSTEGVVPAVYEIAGNREISNPDAKSNWFTSEGVHGRTTILPDGYELVLKFPYDSMGVQRPKVGDVIGFDLALNDNDGTRTRRTQMVWAGAARRWAWLLGTYRDPSRFGQLIFDEG